MAGSINGKKTMTDVQQQRIREILFHVGKIQPSELAPVLAVYYTTLSFPIAKQQLQQLADTLSSISVAVAGFVLETDWQQREATDALQQQQLERRTVGADGGKLLKAEAVAERLGVSTQKVYNMRRRGILKAVNINQDSSEKPCYRFKEADLPI